MDDLSSVLSATDAPTDRPRDTLDARDLPPPQPLQTTLELLAKSDDAVLIQQNDRAPQHLYSQLEERGYRYETVERADDVVTVVWQE